MDSLTLTTSLNGDVAIVSCRGDLLRGEPARRLRAQLSEVMDRHRRVAIDLASVTRMDAGGLGSLAIVIAEARAKKCALAMKAPMGRVRRLLSLTRLDTQIRR